MKFILMIFVGLLTGLFAGPLETFKTIQSDFVQSVTNEQNKTIRYEGKFYATKEKKALWQRYKSRYH